MGLMALLGSIGLFGTGLFAAKEVENRVSRSLPKPNTVKHTKPLPSTAYGVDGLKKIYSSISEVVADHADYTAEVLTLSVNGRKKASRIKKLVPGDYVELRASGYDSFVSVYVDGMNVGDMLCPDESRVPSLLSEGKPVDAYLGGRDLEFYYNDECDFCSIIVFYKIPGVPSTRIAIE